MSHQQEYYYNEHDENQAIKILKTKKKKKSHLALIVCCCLIITGAAVGIAVKLYIDNKNANSYDYQIEMAEKELVDRNYENALR